MTELRPEYATSDEPVAPRIQARRRWRISWIWLVPVVAALVGGVLLARQWLQVGPTITIHFQSAEGLEVGQTKVRYKDVVVGVVTGITVAPDRSHVRVSAELDRQAADYVAREGTRFWVVRPRLGLSGVSGLGTLLSGAYIGVDVLQSPDDGMAARHFVGLEKPPAVIGGDPGRRFVLRAQDLGSLDIGSPVYFRRIPVGRVIGYDLSPDGTAVDVQIFVDAPHDRHVTGQSRFWNASGVNLSLDADGFNVRTGSLAALIAGGVSFAQSHEGDPQPAAAGAVFELANTQAQAMADPDGRPFVVEFQFHHSVRGLRVGAPVDFRGMELGRVFDIDLEYDKDIRRFYVLVKAELYPMRFGPVYDELVRAMPALDYPGSVLLGPLVRHGLRAQLRVSSLLTGQQYLALDFFPNADPVPFDDQRVPLQLPTVAGNFDRLQQQLGSIVAKIDAIPVQGITDDLRDSLTSVTALLRRLDGQVAPQATQALRSAQRALDRVSDSLRDDAPLPGRVDRTLGEFGEAAQALRALADYLQANPTAPLRGVAPDAPRIRP